MLWQIVADAKLLENGTGDNAEGINYDFRFGKRFLKAHSENEIPSQTGKTPNAIYDFPERLQQLIEKYKPVKPQTISEELKKLQFAFNDSQDKLNSNIQNINEAITDMRKELTNEIRDLKSDIKEANQTVNSLFRFSNQ